LGNRQEIPECCRVCCMDAFAGADDVDVFLPIHDQGLGR
jgi:hypothetical protein